MRHIWPHRVYHGILVRLKNIKAKISHAHTAHFIPWLALHCHRLQFICLYWMWNTLPTDSSAYWKWTTVKSQEILCEPVRVRTRTKTRWRRVTQGSSHAATTLAFCPYDVLLSVLLFRCGYNCCQKKGPSPSARQAIKFLACQKFHLIFHLEMFGQLIRHR